MSTACIFCYQPSHDSKSVEHIIPESLGNSHYILNKGIVCDKCNNYFSIKIERDLLNLPYFKSIRYQLNIQNKNGKIPNDGGFIIEPYIPIELNKNKEKGESISIGNLDILELSDDIEVINLVYASPGQNSILVSKFLGKVAIEALALVANLTNSNLDERVNQECLNDLKNYVRYGKKCNFWPYYERYLYHPEEGMQDPTTGDYYFIVSSMRFIYTEKKQLFHQFLLCGTEFTIDLLNPTTQFIEEWFRINNNRSPVFEGASSQGNSQSDTLNFL